MRRGEETRREDRGGNKEMKRTKRKGGGKERIGNKERTAERETEEEKSRGEEAGRGEETREVVRKWEERKPEKQRTG